MPKDITIGSSQKHQRRFGLKYYFSKIYGVTVETVTPLKEDGSLILYSWNGQKKEKQLSGIPPRTL